VDPQSLLVALFRGLGLLSLMAVIGGLVLERAIVPSGVPDLAFARARLHRWITSCLIILALASLADLLIRTRAMSRAGLATAVLAVPTVVARTHLGAILGARFAALVLAVPLSLARATPLRVLCLIVALWAALATSLTGHAVDWGDLTVSVAIDWMHTVAASAWIGGLIALALVVFRQKPDWPSSSLAVIARRFSLLAGICVLVVSLTGAYNAWAQVEVVSRLWTTAYGRVLILKVLVVGALLWLGAVNRFLIVPRLGPGHAPRRFGARLFRVARLAVLGPRRRLTSTVAASRLAAYVAGESIIAVAVIACTAVLGELTPARHVQLDRRPPGHAAPAEVRAGSGARIPATVTPPPGDAARGRAVFAKLKCFACHTIEGERFPAAIRPGPNLSGIGRRHPAYLIESIMNPNALILDGPGYTDDRGLSIMPEYRQNMTVGELVDVVAYLRSLDDPSRAQNPAQPR
jgi:copper resistance protein D